MRNAPSRNLTLLIAAGLMLCMCAANAQQKYRKAMFPHRSVGLCFWDRSQVSCLTPPTTVRNEINSYNSSHSYSGSNAVSMDDFPDEPGGSSGHNHWYDWVNVFSGADPWSQTFYSLLDQYPVVIVKSGYPVTQFMDSDDSIASYQREWRTILNYMKARPQNFFVITTNYPAATDGHATRDARSNTFCLWAKNTLATGNDSYGPFPSNVYVFDWFHILASSVDGYCDPAYGSVAEENSNPACPGPGGDHPSNLAVSIVDPLFVQEVFDAAIAFENGDPNAVVWAGPPSLTATGGGRVRIAWETLSETNTYRFYVERDGSRGWLTVDSVAAAGTTLQRRQYAVTDSGAQPGTSTYRVRQVDLDGSTRYSQAVSITVPGAPPGESVNAFQLEQNFPNPFNPTTTISYDLPVRTHVSLAVYNGLGQRVATVIDEIEDPGTHRVVFDGSRIPSGAYFYRIQTPGFTRTKVLVLVR